jgi:hypothetical protein
MFEFLLGAVVGVVVGWQVPQPAWAKKLMDDAKAKLSEYFSEKRDG